MVHPGVSLVALGTEMERHDAADRYLTVFAGVEIYGLLNKSTQMGK